MPRPDLPRLGRAALAALAALLATSPGGAQTPAQPAPAAAVRTDPLCWRGRPLPRCRDFVLLEVGYHHVLGTTSLSDSSSVASGGRADRRGVFARQLSWTLGAMRNVDDAHAIGGAVVLGITGEGGLVAGTLRARQWLGPDASVEGAVGPAAAQVPVRRSFESPSYGTIVSLGAAWRGGAMAEGRVNLADLAALSARAVVVPRVNGRLHGALLVGASTGSTAAGIASVGIAVVTALAIAALAGAY